MFQQQLNSTLRHFVLFFFLSVCFLGWFMEMPFEKHCSDLSFMRLWLKLWLLEGDFRGLCCAAVLHHGLWEVLDPPRPILSDPLCPACCTTPTGQLLPAAICSP